MSIILPNIAPVIAADPACLGAAVKILAAGGSSLTEDQQKRASQSSKFFWTSRGEEIAQLVCDLEASPAAVQA